MDPVTGTILFNTAAAGVQTILGNNAAAEAEKNANKAAQKAQKYNKKVWRIDNRNIDRAYEVAVQNQDIQHRNIESNLKFQEEQRQQQYDYGMGIRDYNFNQQMRAYDESVNRANQQKSFNQLAEEQALASQQAYLAEQVLGLSFDRTQMLTDYSNAVAGNVLAGKKVMAEADLSSRQAAQQARIQQRQARTETQFGLQESRIAELEAKGSALAIGQAGRSARKVAQGIGAKAGRGRAVSIENLAQQEQSILSQLVFNQESIVNQLLFAKQGIELDYKKLNDQLNLDSAQLRATQQSLLGSDAAARRQIKMERKQADLNAEASIRLKPEIAPPLPEMLTLPRPEKLEIFKPEGRPEPIKKAVYVPDNSAVTIAKAFTDIGGSIIESGVLNDLFNFGGGGGVGASNPWGAGNVTGIENNFGSTVTFYSGGPGQLDY